MLAQSASIAVAQEKASRPQFTIAQRYLRPGGILEIYGAHLGPEPACGTPIPQNGPYPAEACGVRVTVGDQPAGLMYVGAQQVNIKLPRHLIDAPTAMRICFRDLCSDRVPVEINSYTTFLKVQGQAYINMPIWVEVDLPYPFHFGYPCRPDPWDFHGARREGLPNDVYRMEVRQKGVPLAPAARTQPAAGTMQIDGCMSDSGFQPQKPRFPLHLAYRIQTPGTYSIRLVGSQGPSVIAQSNWTDIEVKVAPPAIRDAWLSATANKLKSATPEELIGDLVPSLLAAPDEHALRILQPVFASWPQGRSLNGNRDLFIASFLRNARAALPAAH
jgi:hypothetical protein